MTVLLLIKCTLSIPFPQVRRLSAGTTAIVKEIWREKLSKISLDSEGQQE